MNQYVRCLKNDSYLEGDIADTFFDLKIGQVYKQLPLHSSEEGSGMVRVIDGSGEAYLYPEDYFEPLLLSVAPQSAVQPVTVHVDATTRGILHAEALAANKSISALVREWIDERLDLPLLASTGG